MYNLENLCKFKIIIIIIYQKENTKFNFDVGKIKAKIIKYENYIIIIYLILTAFFLFCVLFFFVSS